MNTKYVFPVMFRRKQNGKLERGIAIGNSIADVDVILDEKLKPVKYKGMWSYTSLSSEGCLPILL